MVFFLWPHSCIANTETHEVVALFFFCAHLVCVELLICIGL